MKTTISKLATGTLILIFAGIYGTGFSQKSVNYQSVGTNLDEINSFFDDTCNKADKISTRVVNEIETLVEHKKTSEMVNKVSEWGQIQLKDLDAAAHEAKVWLRTQRFVPVKHSRAMSKDLAEKE
jgi:hypothetical protein